MSLGRAIQVVSARWGKWPVHPEAHHKGQPLISPTLEWCRAPARVCPEPKQGRLSQWPVCEGAGGRDGWKESAGQPLLRAAAGAAEGGCARLPPAAASEACRLGMGDCSGSAPG